jgi:hypothetical protein
MLKGLFTPPQDEEHINRDALREESLDTQEGNDGSVPVVVESEQQHEQQKKRREEGKNFDRTFPRAEQKLIRDEGGERRTGRDNAVGKRWHILFPFIFADNRADSNHVERGVHGDRVVSDNINWVVKN